MPSHQVTSLAPFDAAQVDRLAELCVKVGVNLQPGQDLLLNAPVEALPLVRRVAEHAYRAGAGLVVPVFSDAEITRARFHHAGDDSFDRAPGWLHSGMGQALGEGAALVSIVGTDPMLLADQDPDKVGRSNKANVIASAPVRERTISFDINWNIIAWPTPDWAHRMFPELPGDEALARLAAAVFAAARLDTADPVAAWTAHNAELRRRCDWLNAQNFHALHFTGPGTDLTVGLAEGHEWLGGAAQARNGVMCNPNIPTEEVFTTPHAARVEGYVRSTKPLSYIGSLIEDIRVRFEAGRIVEARASRGESVLQKVLDTDAGARRLGEVALVPHGSPISQSGLLFYNTLFDENAACHIALGQCLSKCFRGGETLTAQDVADRGGNSSMIHIDWMIGSAEIDIDGIHAGAGRTSVFRNGAWAV